ncbi:hypothetical protein GW17_00035481 [Ensete ventricosum]|nr:hypothetical protein GW17_00035481 [Ensete ventricosum]
MVAAGLCKKQIGGELGAATLFGGIEKGGHRREKGGQRLCLVGQSRCFYLVQQPGREGESYLEAGEEMATAPKQTANEAKGEDGIRGRLQMY